MNEDEHLFSSASIKTKDRNAHFGRPS